MTGDSNQNDKTRTHVALTKGTMVSHYRIIEKIGAGLLLYYKVRRFFCNSKACNSAKNRYFRQNVKNLQFSRNFCRYLDV